jgi:hypothetical protein
MPDYNFANIANEVKPVQQTSLADMMNMARSAQAYQQAQQMNPLELQRARAEANVATGTERPRITSAEESAKTAQIGTQSAQLSFDNKQQQIAMDEANSVVQDTRLKTLKENPDDPAARRGAMDALIEARDRMTRRGVNKHVAEMAIAPYIMKAAQGAPTLSDEIQNSISAGTGASGQQAQTNLGLPTTQGVDTGAGVVPITAQPSIRGSAPMMTAGAPLPGATRQLPPTTPLVATEGDNTGLPVGTEYLKGPTGSAIPSKPLVSKLSPSVSGSITANTTIANEDWNQTYKASTEAQQRKGVLQTINKLAPEAFTGVGGSRKELITGIANAVGISAYEAEKASTDELAKNSNLLALAGGNTDAARSLAEIANPNKKMNLPAIQAVVKQLIGVENMKTARADFLGQYRNNPDQYIAQSALFNKFADSRLFQEMDATDVAKLKASMSPQQIAEMTAKIRQAKQLGIIK